MTAKQLSTEDKKQRAVDFLLSRRIETKRADQFNARECAELLNRKDLKSVRDYMNDLVAQGLWETGYALDPLDGRRVKVWWVKITDG